MGYDEMDRSDYENTVDGQKEIVEKLRKTKSRIKTNPAMLRELLTQMSREGCAKCGLKIEYWGSRLCYIEQLPHPYILKYKILCDGCGHDG